MSLAFTSPTRRKATPEPGDAISKEGKAVAFAWAVVLAAPGAACAQDGSGSIIGWGEQVVGVDLSGGLVAVAAGGGHSLGLKSDGSIVAWGYNWGGQCNVPAQNTEAMAIAAGDTAA